MKTCNTCKHWADKEHGAIFHMEDGKFVHDGFAICLNTALIGAFQSADKLYVATKDPQIEWVKIEDGVGEKDIKREFGLITDKDFGCVNHKEDESNRG
jgi:hypothetical protein